MGNPGELPPTDSSEEDSSEEELAVSNLKILNKLLMVLSRQGNRKEKAPKVSLK